MNAHTSLVIKYRQLISMNHAVTRKLVESEKKIVQLLFVLSFYALSVISLSYGVFHTLGMDFTHGAIIFLALSSTRMDQCESCNYRAVRKT